MSPRTASTSPDEQADTTPTAAATPAAVSKKRKIDWETIDEPELFEGFTVKFVTSKKRRKSGRARNQNEPTLMDVADMRGYKKGSLSADIVQANPFPEAPLSAARYTVEPAHIWESTQRYRRFTIGSAAFEIGQCVFIEKTAEEQDSEAALQHWVGRVLEVRAGDASHVYLRVYWLYRPEDLPEGRQPHHGRSELIASNHMDVIDALSVSEMADVVYWDEDPDKPWPSEHQLFWRQTFDLQRTKSKQFSPIREICVDKTPCNPDEPLVQCPSCLVWLHGQCLEDSVVRGFAPQVMTEAPSGKKKRGRPSSSSSLVPPPFTAHLSTDGATDTTYLTVTDLRPTENRRRFNVDIKCLMCNALIEAAPEEIPPEPSATTAVATILPGTESPPGPVAGQSHKPNVRKRGRPRKNPLPVQDVSFEQEPVEGQQEQNTPVSVMVANEVPRKRGRPRKNPLPSTHVAIEQEQRVEDQQEQDALIPVMVADDGKEKPEQEPFTPVPAVASMGQSMFGSMRKLLFRGGV